MRINMEAAAIAKAAASIAEKLKNSRKNKNENNNTGVCTIGISAAVIVMLPAAFICCFFSNLSFNGALSKNVDGVDYYEATYSINDGSGNKLIYKTTSQEEENAINNIKKLMNEEGVNNGNNFTEGEGTVVNGIYNHNIELLLQWDGRWGGKGYGSSTIGKGGCGPTSLAMIINSFGGNVTPLDVTNYSVKAGYRVDGVGTSWGLFTTGAKAFGLNGTQISRSKESIKAAIGSGQPIISSMTKGHFTNNGHFIVIADCNEDGSKVYIKDPNSEEKSKWWDTSLVINESAAMWAFAAA